MTVLASGLETVAEGTSGGNDVYTSNWQLIDSKLQNVFNADVVPGSTPQTDSAEVPADPAAATAESLTSGAGSATNTINDVGSSFDQSTLNDNFASLVDECNKYRADILALYAAYADMKTKFGNLQTAHNNLLAKLRETGGVGILSD